MKNHSISFTLTIFSLFLVLSSCNSEKIFPPSEEQSNTYYPLIDGHEALFEIYDIQYNILATDSLHYFQKEETELLSYTSDSTYALIHVSVSDSVNGSYKPTSIYSVRFYNNGMTENKNNTRTLVLLFPLKSNKTFDYNFYNTSDSLLATITKFETTINTTDFTGNNTYTNSLEIETINQTNFVETIHEHKIYQEGQGLVYALDLNLDTQPGQNPTGHQFLKRKITHNN